MQELVIESLVVSLAMVVFYVLVDETTQMPLAERGHACETLLFDRPDEPLGIGVEIGTLRRQPNRLNTGALQDLAKDPRIEGIAVVNQMARPAQTAIDRVGHIAGLLLHPRAARLRVDPGDGHAAGSQLDHEEDEVPPEPRQRQHLDGEQIAGRQALPVRLQERLPGHVPAPLGRRVDSVVVQDPLHRGPGDSVAEVRERAADPRVAPPRIVDRHPDHELGDVLSGHWSTSTSAGAAIVFLGDQSPVPTQDRIRGDDACDLRQDPPAEFVTAHSESTTLGVRQAKRPRAQVFSEDPIRLPEIVDQIVLVTVHPASEREDEELQRRRHSLRLLGRLDQHRPSLGRFFAPYGEQACVRPSRSNLAAKSAPRAGLADEPELRRRDARQRRREHESAWRGLIAQARPGAVDFLQLAESRPLKTFNRAFCPDLFRGRAELPVELLPREAQRSLEGERPVREPEVQVEAERRPLHRLEDMQVNRYRVRDDLVEKLLPELDRAVP